MLKNNTRVKTKFGNGTIVAHEGPYGTYNNPWFTYGILHDVFPENVPRMFTNDVMFFEKKEFTLI